MLQLSYNRVKPGKVDKLRAWMRELVERRDEVIESFEQEGVRHEMTWLLEDGQGFILVYAIEAEDIDKAREAYGESTLPIDLEHRAVLQDVLGARVEPELLCDLAVQETDDVTSSEPLYVSSPRLILRKPRMNDAPLRYKWFADPDVTRYLPLAGKGELPMENIRDYLEHVIASTRPAFDVSIDLQNGATVGSASFRDIVEKKSAELSIIIGESDARGRGLGREAIGLMIDYGFGDMELERIWLIVRADNDVAVGLFESLGFETIEVMENAVVIDEIPRDKLRMELTTTRWGE